MSVARARTFRWLALILIALAAGLMFLGPAEQPNSATGMLPDGSESSQVAELRNGQSDDENGTAIVLFSSDGQLDFAALGERADELGGPLIPNEDGTGAIVPVEINSNGLTDNADKITELRETVSADLPEGVSAQVTGPAAINADLSGVFSGANFLLLGVTAIIVAVLLIITYRSPVLWIIPLLVIGIADRVTATVYTWFLDAFGVVWNESTGGILSVLVFGAGTNYALLLISRYRDELYRHEDRFAAMAAAWGPTVRTILASAVTVVIGVACLMLSASPATRGLGLASALGISIAFIFGAFVLPGVLLLFGRWIFWPRRPEVGQQPDHKFWNRIANGVRRRPVPVLVAALTVLGISCVGYFQVSTGISQSEQFIETPESISASVELSEKFPGQDATPAIVLTSQPDEATAILEREGAIVQPGDPVGDQAVLQVSGPDTLELRELLAGTDSLVGGQDAELQDAEDYGERDRMIIFPLVLLLVFVALIVLLRSLLAPAIMVASVLLTNVAALGLGWWVSSGLFGFENFDAATPLYAFVFLVALGIDYTIFLVTRAREEATTHGTKEGILRSLSSTGGVITSAGILLAAVFAALGVLPLVVLAQVGIVIFIGVLLDTLIVRTILVPALVQLLGEKFWWPAKVDSKADAQAAAESQREKDGSAVPVGTR